MSRKANALFLSYIFPKYLLPLEKMNSESGFENSCVDISFPAVWLTQGGVLMLASTLLGSTGSKPTDEHRTRQSFSSWDPGRPGSPGVKKPKVPVLMYSRADLSSGAPHFNSLTGVGAWSTWESKARCPLFSSGPGSLGSKSPGSGSPPPLVLSHVLNGFKHSLDDCVKIFKIFIF